MSVKTFVLNSIILSIAFITMGAQAADNKAPVVPGQRVLSTAYLISFTNREVIKGSCWDFVNAVYTRAGYGEKNRMTLFKSVKKGPYADTDLLIPGDWVAHVNAEYGNVEHSAIFVHWIDKEKKIAETIDYAGMNREEPGRFREHQLTMVYMIIRPKIVKAAAVK
jgi:nitrogen fixation protein FixH